MLQVMYDFINLFYFILLFHSFVMLMFHILLMFLMLVICLEVKGVLNLYLLVDGETNC